MYINYFFLKSTYIANFTLSTNPVVMGVKILYRNKGVTLWKFWVTLWKFWVTLWKFYSQFQHRVIHKLSTARINRRIKLRKTKFLTGKQRLVFDFIRQRIYNGLPPSYSEIADHFGFSLQAAVDHLTLIAKKGYIQLKPRSSRTITLLPPYKDDTRHSFSVDTDVLELGILKGDFLLIDTARLPVAEGEVILSTQGQIKRFGTGDTAFGKIMGISRTID